jgi:hypothetical protein
MFIGVELETYQAGVMPARKTAANKKARESGLCTIGDIAGYTCVQLPALQPHSPAASIV